MIYGVKSGEVDNWWFLVEKHIKAALKYGLDEYTSEDIKELCKKQEMQLWVYGSPEELKGCFVTQILNYPQMKILLVLLLAGKDFKKHLEEVYELLNRFGKDKDCKFMEIFGRKGWGSYLKDLEVKEKVRMYTKEIL